MAKKMKKIITLSVIATTVGASLPHYRIETKALTQDFVVSTVENPALSPMPKKVKYQDEIIELTTSVNLIGKEQASTQAISALENFLKENGITINETQDENSSTIYIGEDDDQIESLNTTREQLGLKDANGLKNEGYVLGIDNQKNGTIVIEGKDETGTFYGVQTLKQLAKKVKTSLNAKEVRIEDEPTMSIRGSIEGFYGIPWTHQNRLDQIKFYGESKLNTYIYAPKDDEYHREKWREPYPETEMVRMNELIQTAKNNKVDFVFALSPGNDIVFDGEQGEKDYQAFINKCEKMYEMGVRSFAVFFDDIKDKSGVKQAEFLNRFNKEFVQAKKDVTPLITVPTEYDTNAMNDGTSVSKYTQDFSKTLDKSIKVLWTGSAVVSEGISVENAKYVKNIYGDRVGIWWNYPVTDYIKDKLALGPVYGLDKGLSNELDYLVFNPMEHAELSKISILTGADYAWNTADYDHTRSFENSINELYGSLAKEMYTFANHSTRLVASWASTGRADAPEVKTLMDEFIRKIAKDEDVSKESAALQKEFESMVSAADTLKQKFTAEELKHCEGNLNKLKALGQADQKALSLFLAIKEGNNEQVETLRQELKYELNSLNSGKLVSEKTALQFVKDAINYDVNATADFSVSNTFVTPGTPIQLINESSISSTEYEWQFPGAVVETSQEENPTVTYDQEGTYTITLVSKNKLGESKKVKEHLITVSKEANSEKTNLSLNKTVTASDSVGGKETPDKAVDGLNTTKWCQVGGTQWLLIDLGDEKTITDIQMAHAEAGGEGASSNTYAYTIEVSNDGKSFREVVNVTNNTEGETQDFIPVTTARYVRLNVKTPTQPGGDNAARIYEVTVNGLDRKIDIPPVYVVDKTPLTNKVNEASLITEDQLANVVSTYVQEFKQALQEAEDLLKKDDVAKTELNASLTRLTTAIENLKYVKGDTKALQALVSEVEDYQKDEYTQETWVIFENTLTKAKDLLSQKEVSQIDVDAMMTELQGAIKQLVETPKVEVSKAELDKAIQEAKGLDAKDYTEESYKVLSDALIKAQEMMANENATQEEVNAMVTELQGAIKQLVKVEDSKDESNPPVVTPGEDTKTDEGVKTGDRYPMLTIVGLVASLSGIALFRKKKHR